MQHLTLSLLSLLFFCIGVKFSFPKGRASKKYSCILGVFFLLYLSYSIFYGVCYSFTGKGINHAVLYHIKYGLDGAGYGEYSKLILTSVFTLCFLFVIGCYLLLSFSKSKKELPLRFIFLSIIFLFFSGLVHPATLDINMLTKTNEGEPFWKYYRTPYIKPNGGKPKNLIFIYAESLERTYFNEEIFPGLIKKLKTLESESISFTNIGKYPETGWTVAGMVSSQCGLPLITPSHGNSMSDMDLFLSGAVCMGDLLSREGYYLTFMGGASLNFAGKGKFYKTHSFDEVFGRNELLPLLKDKSYISNWGLYDDSLFDIAYEKYESLSRSKQPFGIFLLTLDTHGSNNNYSRSCKGMEYKDGKNGMLNAVACSDFQIGNFIDRIRQSPFFNNTVIVVASDHYAMWNSASGMLKKSKKRRNLFLVFPPETEAGFKSSIRGSTLDTGITVLSVLGFESYLGLGRNLLQEDTSILKSVKHIDTTLNSWRKEIVKFWSFPEITESIEINSKRKFFKIDDRVFNTPVLIQYNKKLQTKMWFEPYVEPNHKTLMETLKDFAPNTPFLLINDCKNIPVEWTRRKGEGLCFVNGKLGSSEIRGDQVAGSELFTAEELKIAAQKQVSNTVYKENLKHLELIEKIK